MFRIIGSDRLRSITVQVKDPSAMTLAMIEIEQILRSEHGIRPGGDQHTARGAGEPQRARRTGRGRDEHRHAHVSGARAGAVTRRDRGWGVVG